MIPMQATDKLLEGDIFAFVVEVYTGSAMPMPIFALLVFGTIGISYYVVQRSIAIPLVMFVIVGGTTISLAPTVFQQAIMGAFVVAITGLGYVLLNKVRV